MLTKGDDYPIHQRPDPVAMAGTDRNFYDRYFFNGYNAGDGSHFFGAALGVYPHLNIMDASFSVISEGVQHNLHASRVMHMERMDTRVGPIRIEVIEPLVSLRITVDGSEHGIGADLTFRARTPVLEEPRFAYRLGPRTIMDSTRLTQNGAYEGWIEVKGNRIDITPEVYLGTRDRSWGVRPIGGQDPQPVAPPPIPQFYWLWAPLNFKGRSTFFARNEDGEGQVWNQSGAIAATDSNDILSLSPTGSSVTLKKGTRHAEDAEFTFSKPEGGRVTISLVPQFNFYMAGLGYMHPEWGHGLFKGESAEAYETFDLENLDETAPLFLHVQAFCTAELRDGNDLHKGSGVLEQLILGPHKPSGLKEFMDGAG